MGSNPLLSELRASLISKQWPPALYLLSILCFWSRFTARPIAEIRTFSDEFVRDRTSASILAGMQLGETALRAAPHKLAEAMQTGFAKTAQDMKLLKANLIITTGLVLAGRIGLLAKPGP